MGSIRVSFRLRKVLKWLELTEFRFICHSLVTELSQFDEK